MPGLKIPCPPPRASNLVVLPGTTFIAPIPMFAEAMVPSGSNSNTQYALGQAHVPAKAAGNSTPSGRTTSTPLPGPVHPDRPTTASAANATASVRHVTEAGRGRWLITSMLYAWRGRVNPDVFELAPGSSGPNRPSAAPEGAGEGRKKPKVFLTIMRLTPRIP